MVAMNIIMSWHAAYTSQSSYNILQKSYLRSNFPNTVPKEETKYIRYNKVYLVVYQSNDEQHGTAKQVIDKE